jgi:hypothetical protein
MHTSRNGKSSQYEFPFRPSKIAGIYYRNGESGASLQDAASVFLNLRQDGSPLP